MYFAQMIPGGLDGPICPLYADQFNGASSIWISLVILFFATSVITYFFKQRSLAISLALGSVILILLKVIYSANECGHGGLFAANLIGLTIFGLFALSLLVINIVALTRFLKQKHHGKSDK